MNDILPRHLAGSVAIAARALPVVVITGARQTGKSTLVRELLPGRRSYYSLDDIDVRAQAEREPDDLVARAKRLTLDEVQRVPDLLLAVKRAVDADRRPGQFILTGSANLLLMKSVSESLAGRAVYLTLWPMTSRERRGGGRAGLWSELFEAPVEDWVDTLDDPEDEPEDWRAGVLRGGYPVPALELEAGQRSIWLDGYVQTYLERDLQDLSAITDIVDFRRLMRAACLRVGQLVNQTELGRDIGLPQPTVRRWLNVLETSYLLVRLPAYPVNRTKRLIRTPKLYWCDAALALRLGAESRPRGPHLENLVLSDLLTWRDAALQDRADLFYWRTATGEEVDFVIERGRELIAVEVKSGVRPRARDIRHLRTFLEEYGSSVRGCLLLHAGPEVEWLAPRILSAPWWRVV